jgi:endonuclease/exonuclease/phosphatase family metal-dependent hydrolase
MVFNGFSLPSAGRHRAARRPRRWLVTATAVAASLTGAWAVPTAASAASTVTAMSFNMCGVVCRKGEVRTTAAYTASKITGKGVTVAFLQEVCYSQYRQLKGLVEGKGYTTAFASQTSSGTCDNVDSRYGRGFGTAIVVKGRSTGRTVLPLPVPPGVEKRNLLGLTATIGGRSTFVATVHTSPGVRSGLDQQLPVLAKFLNARASRPVIVGGDFNALPTNPAMARFYSPAAGGTGAFTELDEAHAGAAARSGRATFDVADRKIDYLFVSRTHFGSPRASTGATSMSDHRLYVGTANLK